MFFLASTVKDNNSKAFGKDPTMYGKKTGRVIEIVGLCILCNIMTGFAADRVNLSNSGQILLNIIAPEELSVSDINIFQENNNLIIDGKVESKFPHCNKEGGHADIVVLNPKGIIIKKITIDFRFSKRGCIRGRSPHGYFEARTIVAPPKGSTVRLVFYD
jgi:hypothetical protein